MMKIVGIYGGGLALSYAFKKYLDSRDKTVEVDSKGDVKR